jgi:hypothetical protein
MFFENCDEIDQVRLQPVGVAEQACERPRARVVERQPGLLAHERVAEVFVRGARDDLRDLVTLISQDAVEPAQDRHGQDHIAVLVRLVHAAQLIRDRPDERPQAAQR